MYSISINMRGVLVEDNAAFEIKEKSCDDTMDFLVFNPAQYINKLEIKATIASSPVARTLFVYSPSNPNEALKGIVATNIIRKYMSPDKKAAS